MNPPLPKIDYAFLEDFLVRLLNTPSPTGHSEQAITLVQETLAALPSLSLRRTRKGALLATLPGPEADPVRALTGGRRAHLCHFGSFRGFKSFTVRQQVSSTHLPLTCPFELF